MLDYVRDQAQTASSFTAATVGSALPEGRKTKPVVTYGTHSSFALHHQSIITDLPFLPSSFPPELESPQTCLLVPRVACRCSRARCRGRRLGAACCRHGASNTGRAGYSGGEVGRLDGRARKWCAHSFVLLICSRRARLTSVVLRLSSSRPDAPPLDGTKADDDCPRVLLSGRLGA